MGQKQLISFTGALLADPKILILDEAIISVDRETARIIHQGCHDKLIQDRGRYYQLFTNQFKKEAIEKSIGE